MKNSYKIFYLHLIFFIIFSVLSAFLWGAGHGSSVPLVVFFAPFLISFYAENYNETYTVLLLLQMPIYGLICYLFSINRLDKKYRFIPALLHSGLAFVAVFITSSEIRESYYYFFIFSIFVMLAYWKIFLTLVGCSKKIADHKVSDKKYNLIK